MSEDRIAVANGPAAAGETAAIAPIRPAFVLGSREGPPAQSAPREPFGRFGPGSLARPPACLRFVTNEDAKPAPRGGRIDGDRAFRALLPGRFPTQPRSGVQACRAARHRKQSPASGTDLSAQNGGPGLYAHRCPCADRDLVGSAPPRDVILASRLADLDRGPSPQLGLLDRGSFVHSPKAAPPTVHQHSLRPCPRTFGVSHPPFIEPRPGGRSKSCWAQQAAQLSEWGQARRP